MQAAPPLTITTAITVFLGSAPSLEEIIAFQLPETLEERGAELLTLRREGSLFAEEQAELDEFTQIGLLITQIKAQARLKLAAQK